MTIPQFQGMPTADKSRKTVLVDHGFRLPSAIQHRPLGFDELTTKLEWTPRNENLHPSLRTETKHPYTLFVSATPASYEFDLCTLIVQQIIRPTGLLDPITYVYPTSGNYQSLEASLEKVLASHPELTPLVVNYDDTKLGRYVFNS